MNLIELMILIKASQRRALRRAGGGQSVATSRWGAERCGEYRLAMEMV